MAILRIKGFRVEGCDQTFETEKEAQVFLIGRALEAIMDRVAPAGDAEQRLQIFGAPEIAQQIARALVEHPEPFRSLYRAVVPLIRRKQAPAAPAGPVPMRRTRGRPPKAKVA